MNKVSLPHITLYLFMFEKVNNELKTSEKKTKIVETGTKALTINLT